LLNDTLIPDGAFAEISVPHDVPDESVTVYPTDWVPPCGTVSELLETEIVDDPMDEAADRPEIDIKNAMTKIVSTNVFLFIINILNFHI
jgi:hypothetical protein